MLVDLFSDAQRCDKEADAACGLQTYTDGREDQVLLHVIHVSISPFRPGGGTGRDPWSCHHTGWQTWGIGARLLEYAVEHMGAQTLWALEQNAGAIRFYLRHGFRLTDERQLEDGTSEYLVQMQK